VERVVADSCDMTPSNLASVSIAYKERSFTKQTEERYRKECLPIGCWLASGDADGLYVRTGEERKGAREREKGNPSKR
jgi:hypothetical protein